jgi:Meiotically Up-regulated Gene 113 (MUG113) protein
MSESYRPDLKIFGVAKRDKGWLYLLRSGHLLKIGKTSNPTRRLSKDAKTWLPDAEVIAVKPFWNVSDLERQLHEAFCRYWYEGEWFKIDDQNDRAILIDGFREFSDDDIDVNSVDFIYWFNSMGMLEFSIERRARQKLTMPKWLRQESANRKK